MTGLTSKTTSKPASVLVVRLGTDLHAIPIEWIEEVLPALPIERVPQCPAFVLGVIFVRGHLIPVLDAAERLGQQGHLRERDPHIICVRVNNRLVGLEVDEALDLMEIDSAMLLRSEEIGLGSGIVSGVLDNNGVIIRVLDLTRLMDREEAAQLRPLPQKS